MKVSISRSTGSPSQSPFQAPQTLGAQFGNV
jgi:hypothetical protein